jgi:hypothetical protein
VLGVGIKPVGADRERLTSTPFGHHPPCLRSPESKLLPQLHPHFPCVASRRCSPAAVAARHHLVSYLKPELRPRKRRFSWQRHRAPPPFQASAHATPEQLLVADRSSPSGVASAEQRTPPQAAARFPSACKLRRCTVRSIASTPSSPRLSLPQRASSAVACSTGELRPSHRQPSSEISGPQDHAGCMQSNSKVLAAQTSWSQVPCYVAAGRAAPGPAQRESARMAVSGQAARSLLARAVEGRVATFGPEPRINLNPFLFSELFELIHTLKIHIFLFRAPKIIKPVPLDS